MSKNVTKRDSPRKRSPVTAQQLADMINAMPRKARLSLANDLENIAAGLQRFAKLVRK